MAKTMPAVVNYSSQPGAVEVREVPLPEISDQDVLLKVEAASICGSDLHQWHGTHSWKVNYPVTLGHEFCGTIERAGNRVRKFKEGDRVVSETAAVIDEFSPYSRRGMYHLDPNRLGFGYGVDGAMTHYVNVPERCLHSMPKQLGFEKAALTEPCCVAYNAVCVNALVRPGDHVLVIGPGPIGLLCALMAKLNGTGHLIVSGLRVDARRLAVAKQLGADATLDSDVVDYIKNLGDGYGVDVVIDAAGASSTFQLAMQVVRPAGQIVKVGWGPQPLGYNLDPMVQKAVTVQGSFSHNWPIWERVIQMIATDQINLDCVISRVAGLTDWQDCFENMQSGYYVKAVLKPGL
jgi:L-iditol 2-dehydrogenase